MYFPSKSGAQDVGRNVKFPAYITALVEIAKAMRAVIEAGREIMRVDIAQANKSLDPR